MFITILILILGFGYWLSQRFTVFSYIVSTLFVLNLSVFLLVYYRYAYCYYTLPLFLSSAILYVMTFMAAYPVFLSKKSIIVQSLSSIVLIFGLPIAFFLTIISIPTKNQSIFEDTLVFENKYYSVYYHQGEGNGDTRAHIFIYQNEWKFAKDKIKNIPLKNMYYDVAQNAITVKEKNAKQLIIKVLNIDKKTKKQKTELNTTINL